MARYSLGFLTRERMSSSLIIENFETLSADQVIERVLAEIKALRA